jgi:hypothetical protein
MCGFKSLTGYIDCGGYVMNGDSAYIHIRVNDHIVAGRSVFIHDQQQVYYSFWSMAEKL